MVGTVLLIAIMLITVSALMFWGVPAIQEMERESQFRAVQSAFTVLDGVVDEVLPETGSARIARLPLQGGGLSIEPSEDPYAVAWSPSGSATVTFGDLDDGDENVTFSSSVGISDCVFTHLHENGTLDASETVAPSGSSCVASQNLTATHRLRVRDSGGAAVGVVWLFHPGRIRYTSDGAAGPFTIDYHNGAVTSDFRGGGWVYDDPLVLKLRDDGLTVGLIDLNGTFGATGGDGTARVQVELASSQVRGDAQAVHKVDIYPLGEMDTGWRRFYNVSARYEFAHTSGDEFVRYETGGSFPVTLTHYIVATETAGVG